MVAAKDVMRRKVKTVSADTTLDKAAKIMSNNRIGSVVVLDDKKPVGIVTAEDIVYIVAHGKSPKKTKVKAVEKRGFFTAGPQESLMDITKKMITHQVKRLPIVKDDKLLGIITDKEILISTPEMIKILSEKLKMRAERVASPRSLISGICENCEGYSDRLRHGAGEWICETCRN